MEIKLKEAQPLWQRIILLAVIGYEAAGCLLGGIFLVAEPDGSIIKMPVERMRGACPRQKAISCCWLQFGISVSGWTILFNSSSVYS